MSPKNFAVDDRVVLDNLNSVMNGSTGTVLGKGISFDQFGSSYIVLLDVPTPTHKAILVTEACIFHLDKRYS